MKVNVDHPQIKPLKVCQSQKLIGSLSFLDVRGAKRPKTIENQAENMKEIIAVSPSAPTIIIDCSAVTYGPRRNALAVFMDMKFTQHPRIRREQKRN